jgi:hypothetical protein
MTDLRLDEPVIILTAGRSGSTLLRHILDAHPDVACPPETNIVNACAQLAFAWRSAGAGLPSGGLSEAATAGLRATVDGLFRDYLSRRGKTRWCDKSLGSAPTAGWFAELYPRARFICLVRHAMDVIYSGLEASPWGLMGYGFEQFGGLRGGNNVAALAAYWIEHTGRILEFEQQHAGRFLRVRYEDLVRRPADTAAGIFAFIGVPDVPGLTDGGLVIDQSADGPGDHKIRATAKITTRSVGRGVRVPAEVIPPAQLGVMNHLLGELGYTPVDEAWRASPRPPELVPDSGADPVARPAPRSLLDVSEVLIQAVLQQLDSAVPARIRLGFRQGLPGVPAADLDRATTFELIAYHPDAPAAARSWRVDLDRRSVRSVPAEAADRFQAGWLVTGDVEAWLGILSGRANMESCLRSGLLRHIAPTCPAGRPPADRQLTADRQLAVVRELLGLSGYPEDILVSPPYSRNTA